MSDETDFYRIVSLERASRVTGIPIGTLRDWVRKGAVTRYTNAGGTAVLVDLDELRPRPVVAIETQQTA